MPNARVILNGEVITDLSPNVQAIVRHLCEGDCHAFGDLVEWCESRHDCTIAVICPSCQQRFIVDEDDLLMLERWTEANGIAFGCGVAID